MIETRRLTARVVVGVIAITSLFVGVPTVEADEVSDQKQVVEQLAAELDRLNERIATLDEEYGGAQDEQAELEIEIAASREKVASENAKLTVLQETMTEIAVNRFVGGLHRNCAHQQTHADNGPQHDGFPRLNIRHGRRM